MGKAFQCDNCKKTYADQRELPIRASFGKDDVDLQVEVTIWDTTTKEKPDLCTECIIDAVNTATDAVDNDPP